MLDSLCLLCGTSIESVGHPFFECSFTANLWNKVRGKFKLQAGLNLNIMTEIETLSLDFKNKNKLMDLSRLALSITNWLCRR